MFENKVFRMLYVSSSPVITFSLSFMLKPLRDLILCFLIRRVNVLENVMLLLIFFLLKLVHKLVQ